MMIPSLCAAAVMLVLLFISWKYTPATPSFFGYKSRLSVKNDETWVYANKLANKIFLFNIIALILLSLIAPYLFEEETAVVFPLFAFAFLSVLVVPIVEVFLRRKFDKNGIRKDQL
ncbi:SdpI family protein [Flavobacterium sp. NKUCC04_CG]|uniref:SdpI family protein n=1 Tax=Flavobacterium sp. NKUCC04_CG TaxID=2842121 RepID=UPI001C5AE802|nr:SdpI family protein [Flavobacterium sp. NKUCC04_CG]MBW3518614.1 SdpI family protein [Flavobacterium sp. NKUCC04_CG]